LQLKIDLHVHSHYSEDSLITPEEISSYAKKRELNGVAITDHDRLDGTLEIAKRTDFFIVPGMEITSLEGHIVGLNVQKPIQKGLTMQATLDEIHRAGGIAIACHPTAFFKGSLGKHVSSEFDAIEVINSSAIPFEYAVKRNERIASRLGIPQVAGSDAHYGPEIGYAYTLIDAKPDVDNVVEAIKKGLCKPFGTSIPMTLRLKRELSKLAKKF
jgi:predicted metal-dependent phosphoesterase TrpH